MKQTVRIGEKLKGLATGRTYELGAFINGGGEGKVYGVRGSSDLAAKIYFSPLSRQKAKKLAQMIRMTNPDLAKISAWPVDIVVNAKKQPLGLLMPYVADGTPLHLLLNPKTRRQRMPQLDYGNLVRIGENIARAVAALHNAGIVIGDINGQNFLVRSNGHVHAIDCDSMQIAANRKWLSGVGVEEYVPPELQGQSLTKVRRTTDHDVFAMAVLLFELLNLGRHPFAGHPEIPLGAAIRQGAHVFSRRPPPRSLYAVFGLKPSQVLDREIMELFARSFAKPGVLQAASRPSAQEWSAALKRFKASLVECATKTGHLHPPGAASCPWCVLEARKLSIFSSTPRAAAPKVPPAPRENIARNLLGRALTAMGGIIATIAASLWELISSPFVAAWQRARSYVRRKVQAVMAAIRQLVRDAVRAALNFLLIVFMIVFSILFTYACVKIAEWLVYYLQKG